MGLFDSAQGVGQARRRSDKRSNVDVAKRFELRGRTGQGSMSKVWRAYDRELGRTVCLKLLDKEKTEQVRGPLRRAEEADRGRDLHAPCKHPNIVRPTSTASPPTGEPYLRHGVGRRARAELPDRNAAARSSSGNRDQLPDASCADAVEYMHAQQVPAPRPLPAERDGDQGGRASS